MDSKCFKTHCFKAINNDLSIASTYNCTYFCYESYLNDYTFIFYNFLGDSLNKAAITTDNKRSIVSLLYLYNTDIDCKTTKKNNIFCSNKMPLSYQILKEIPVNLQDGIPCMQANYCLCSVLNSRISPASYRIFII